MTNAGQLPALFRVLALPLRNPILAQPIVHTNQLITSFVPALCRIYLSQVQAPVDTSSICGKRFHGWIDGVVQRERRHLSKAMLGEIGWGADLTSFETCRSSSGDWPR